MNTPYYTGLCKYCNRRPKNLPYEFCGRTCGSLARQAQATAQQGALILPRPGVNMCIGCGLKPKNWDGVRLHDYCSRSCANGIFGIGGGPVVLQGARLSVANYVPGGGGVAAYSAAPPVYVSPPAYGAPGGGGGYRGVAPQPIYLGPNGQVMRTQQHTLISLLPDVITVSCKCVIPTFLTGAIQSQQNVTYSRQTLQQLNWDGAISRFRNDFTALANRPSQNISIQALLLGNSSWAALSRQDFQRLIPSATELRIQVWRAGKWQ